MGHQAQAGTALLRAAWLCCFMAMPQQRPRATLEGGSPLEARELLTFEGTPSQHPPHSSQAHCPPPTLWGPSFPHRDLEDKHTGPQQRQPQPPSLPGPAVSSGRSAWGLRVCREASRHVLNTSTITVTISYIKDTRENQPGKRPGVWGPGRPQTQGSDIRPCSVQVESLPG